MTYKFFSILISSPLLLRKRLIERLGGHLSSSQGQLTTALGTQCGPSQRQVSIKHITVTGVIKQGPVQDTVCQLHCLSLYFADCGNTLT